MSRDDGGEHSDVDLLVTLSPGTSALALGGLLLDAQELLGRRVDVVTEAGLLPGGERGSGLSSCSQVGARGPQGQAFYLNPLGRSRLAKRCPDKSHPIPPGFVTNPTVLKRAPQRPQAD